MTQHSSRPSRALVREDDPELHDAMPALIEEVLQRGESEGYPLTRLVAHMEWALQDRPGVDDFSGIRNPSELHPAALPRPSHMTVRDRQVWRRCGHGHPARVA